MGPGKKNRLWGEAQGGVRGPGSFMGRHPGGLRKPRSGDKEVTSSVCRPRPLALLRQPGEGREGSREGLGEPEAAIWEPGRGKELIKPT